MNGIVDQLSDVAKSNDNDNRKLVKKDDFVINSRSDRKGSSGIAPRDGSVSLINIVLAPKNIDPKFIENLFKSYYFKEEYFRNGKGIHWDLWTTRWEQFKNINIPVPPIEEQKLISRYLDKKTSQIDSLVEKIQKKIDLLKEQRTSLINHYVTKGLDPNVEMKDSGVEWIGEIPRHWIVTKLKNISKVTLGKMLTNDDKGGMVLQKYLRSANVQEDNLDLNDVNEMWFSHAELDKLNLKSGDILVNEGGQVGRPCFIDEDVKDLYFQNSINRIRTKKTVPYFLYLFVLSAYRRGYYDSIVDRVSIPHLTKEKLENTIVIIPSLSEQNQICDVISSRSNTFEILVFNEVKKVELLREFRQSLISSVVTGKLRITEDMI
jgi:type I restriction enzyme S subunit